MNAHAYLLPTILLLLTAISLCLLPFIIMEGVRREALIDKLKSSSEQSESILCIKLLKIVVEEDDRLLVVAPLLFKLVSYVSEGPPNLGVVICFLPLRYAGPGVLGLVWSGFHLLGVYSSKEFNDPLTIGVDDEGWRKFYSTCRELGDFIRENGTIEALGVAYDELCRVSTEIEESYNLKGLILNWPILHSPQVRRGITPYYVNLGPTERDKMKYFCNGLYNKLSPSEVKWISRHFIIVDPVVVYSNRRLVVRAIVHLSVTYFRVSDLWNCKLFIRVYGLGEGVNVYLQNGALIIRIESSPTNPLK